MKNVWGVIGLCLLSMSVNATLVSRSGGSAYYDTVLNITWLADANRAMTTGYGESQPVAPNDTAEGRAQNRRVALEFTESN